MAVEDKISQHDHGASRAPQPGDIISARYRWMQDGDEEPGKKIRPCMVIKAAKDGSSMIIAPISTKQAWQANDCIEIMPPDRKTAGLDENLRSWVKLTEINRVDLPNLAVIPHHTPDGRLMWARGRVSDEVLQNIQSEIAHRIHNKTLSGKHIKSDNVPTLQLAGIRAIKKTPPQEEERPSREEIVRKRAADFVTENSVAPRAPSAASAQTLRTSSLER